MITNIIVPYSLYNYDRIYGSSNGPQNDIGSYLSPCGSLPEIKWQQINLAFQMTFMESSFPTFFADLPEQP